MADIPKLNGKEHIIMRLLVSRPDMYGLELVDASEGALKPGTIYVTLMRMEDKGWIKSRPQSAEVAATEAGPRRRLYTIAAPGRRALQAAELVEAAFASTVAQGA